MRRWPDPAIPDRTPAGSAPCALPGRRPRPVPEPGRCGSRSSVSRGSSWCSLLVTGVSGQAQCGPGRVVEREVPVEDVAGQDGRDVLPGAECRGGHEVAQAQPARGGTAFQEGCEIAG